MKEFNYVIQDEMGLHARPAAILVKKAKEYRSAVSISHGEKKADAKKIISIMQLAIKQGDKVRFTIDGEDEAEAAEDFEKFVREKV